MTIAHTVHAHEHTRGTKKKAAHSPCKKRDEKKDVRNTHEGNLQRGAEQNMCAVRVRGNSIGQVHHKCTL